MTTLHEEPRLSVLTVKNASKLRDHHCLNEVEIDDLYDNIIHFVMEGALCAYMAKEQNKALRREFEAQEMDKNLIQKECSRLKA